MEDATKKPEREMRDMNERPIFMTHFSAEMKAFYIKRVTEDGRCRRVSTC